MKTQTKHTPGPWASVHSGIMGGNRIIAEIECLSTEGKAAEQANAALIAAAPDLLRELKDLLKHAPAPDKNIRKSYSYLLHREAAKPSPRRKEKR